MKLWWRSFIEMLKDIVIPSRVAERIWESHLEARKSYVKGFLDKWEEMEKKYGKQKARPY